MAPLIISSIQIIVAASAVAGVEAFYSLIQHIPFLPLAPLTIPASLYDLTIVANFILKKEKDTCRISVQMPLVEGRILHLYIS
ncbi:hypothetical protein [Paenibacillus agricola]|uniref:hypothetical protein n=1 Tax=Paenibacillus agricola TaxID=2716264 RepID=UPI001A9E1D66|nr:hypothetical protein [Paenibacillus agricola]